eukprot:CAMPEP_0201661582 /NCGR_PEP_ID=MMETSP0494-20130426/3910_1 /ASSEMBLY_ACC=CAM_ASM_000839 /TAXON_ID=420259 /ORGANISM="Thalassiosira gravida, Strain GMp14c1" /LENGTH=590 /DNA_ID=CAMNT_0048139735 /DNA_START=699 /DNA_END=2471 /DNA_ORIENTATION=+
MSIANNIGNIVNKRTMKLLGRAMFDIQDVLGSPNNIKARRLRRGGGGGVVYAHVEQQSSHYPTSPSRSLSPTTSSFDSRRLNLRLRAHSLIHTHSLANRVAPTRTSNPDTYIEISRPSSSSSSSSFSSSVPWTVSPWIVVYRSPPVKESVAPTWDEGMIELSSFLNSASSSSGVGDDLNHFPLRITVYKVKKRKCKEIGSCQTTVANLVEVMVARVTGYEGEQQQHPHPPNEFGDEEGKDNDNSNGGNRKSFRLLSPTAKGDANPSNEMTGFLEVANATIENSHQVMMRSQRFVTDAADDDDNDNDDYNNDNDDVTNERSAWSDGDDDDDDDDANLVPSHHHPRPKFSDYVKAGMLDIDFCVAVDFTSSNGDPRRPGTQHFSRDGMMNDYEEAIEAIGSTIEKYSSTQEYPVWGFGAKYGGKVRHIFQCDPNSPTAHGTQGVLDAYRTVFETDFIMSGPTEINAVLRAAANRSKKYYSAPLPSPQSNVMQYCVLLILTDGIVHNLQSTQELIRKYREFQLPLSVIVVGIGRADFTEFHRWNHSPSDVCGRFKFVEFRQHQFDPDTLSREALLNVPHETVDYFLHRNILPH